MALQVYRIRGWKDHFENNRTRDLKQMEWVPVPNRHDGDGYTELLDHPNGMAHYGAWILILEIASKCELPAPHCGKDALPCDKRGTLLRDGSKPHDAASLARQTRGSKDVFSEALPRLVSIGWLEVVSIDVKDVTVNPAPSCGETAPRCGEVTMEGKGTEGKGIPPIAPKGAGAEQVVLKLEAPEPEINLDEFALEIFEKYPRKEGKAEALKAIRGAFKFIAPLELRIKVAEYAKAVAQWPPGDSQYVPWCQKWMRKKRWLDHPSAWVRTKANPQNGRNNGVTTNVAEQGRKIAEAVAAAQKARMEAKGLL